MSVWALRVFICGSVSINKALVKVHCRSEEDSGKEGNTWIIGRMMDKFNSLVFKSFIEEVCAELKDVGGSFSIDTAIQFI